MTISNMNIYKSLLAFVFCSLLTVTSYAQNSNFTIKGKVTGNTGKALELATIVLNDALSTYTDKNDYEGCREEFFKIFAMEVPFTAEEWENEKHEDLYERAFSEAIKNFNKL